MIIPLLIVIISILVLIIIHRTAKYDAFKLSPIEKPNLGNINTVETYNYSSCIPKCLSIADRRNLVYNTKYVLSDGRCIYNKGMNTPASLLDSVIKYQTDPTAIAGFESCSTATNTMLIGGQPYKSITLVLIGGGGGSGYGITQGAGGAGGIFIKNVIVRSTINMSITVGRGGLSARNNRLRNNTAEFGGNTTVQFSPNEILGYNVDTIPGLADSINTAKRTLLSLTHKVDEYTYISISNTGELTSIIFTVYGGGGGSFKTTSGSALAVKGSASGGGGYMNGVNTFATGGPQGYSGADGNATYGGGGGGSMGPAVSIKGGLGFTSPVITDTASAIGLYNSTTGSTYKFTTKSSNMVAVGGSGDVTEDYAYYIGCGANSSHARGSNGCCVVISKQTASAQTTLLNGIAVGNLNQIYNGYAYYIFLTNSLTTPSGGGGPPGYYTLSGTLSYN